MWIVEPKYPLDESGSSKLNFLYSNEKGTYVMDNHLAATWCWLNEIDHRSTYNYLHIDQHYDLSDDPEVFKKEIRDRGIQIHSLDIGEFLSQTQELPYNSGKIPLFRWDNYISIADRAYPDLFASKVFFTHEERDQIGYEDFISEEKGFLDSQDNIKYGIQDTVENKWIVNVDLDYFFSRSNQRIIQIFSDVFIENIIAQLKDVRDQVEVVTICMSPECCGGWKNSLEVLQIFLRELDLDLQLDIYRMKDA